MAWFIFDVDVWYQGGLDTVHCELKNDLLSWKHFDKKGTHVVGKGMSLDEAKAFVSKNFDELIKEGDFALNPILRMCKKLNLVPSERGLVREIKSVYTNDGFIDGEVVSYEDKGIS